MLLQPAFAANVPFSNVNEMVEPGTIEYVPVTWVATNVAPIISGGRLFPPADALFEPALPDGALLDPGPPAAPLPEAGSDDGPDCRTAEDADAAAPAELWPPDELLAALAQPTSAKAAAVTAANCRPARPIEILIVIPSFAE